MILMDLVSDIFTFREGGFRQSRLKLRPMGGSFLGLSDTFCVSVFFSYNELEKLTHLSLESMGVRTFAELD